LASQVLTGCDSKPKTSVIAPTRLQQFAQAMTLEGLVASDSGPVKTGVVKALSEKGEILASVELQGQSRYSLELPAGTSLPVILTYYPSIDAPESQRMMTVAILANASKYDINPASTRISKQAKALGGYTHNNWVRAAESSGVVPADNKTTAGFRGDPTTQYGGWH
jgi:hypothetical protein